MQRFGMAILLTFAIATGLQARVEQPSISSSIPSIDLTTRDCESSQDAYICVSLVTPDGTLLRAHIITAEKPLIEAFLRDIQYGNSLYAGYFAMVMAMDPMGNKESVGPQGRVTVTKGCALGKVVLKFSPKCCLYKNETGLKRRQQLAAASCDAYDKSHMLSKHFIQFAKEKNRKRAEKWFSGKVIAGGRLLGKRYDKLSQKDYKTIADKVKKTHAGFKKTIEVKCFPNSFHACKTASAFVLPNFKGLQQRVNICEGWFSEGKEVKARIFYHEMTHAFAKTLDHGYLKTLPTEHARPNDDDVTATYTTGSPTRQKLLNNADTYAYYAFE